jgi:hypothetical protein
MRWGGRPFGAILAAIAVAASCAPQPPASDPIARGRQIYERLDCASCHEPSLWNAFRRIGPPLDHVGTVAAERIPSVSAEEYIRRSIAAPGEFVVPGYPDSMPRDLAAGLSAAELDALIAYLASLR